MDIIHATHGQRDVWIFLTNSNVSAVMVTELMYLVASVFLYVLKAVFEVPVLNPTSAVVISAMLEPIAAFSASVMATLIVKDLTNLDLAQNVSTTQKALNVNVVEPCLWAIQQTMEDACLVESTAMVTPLYAWTKTKVWEAQQLQLNSAKTLPTQPSTPRPHLLPYVSNVPITLLARSAMNV